MCIYMYIHAIYTNSFKEYFLLWVIIRYFVWFSVLYSRFLLLIYLMYSSLFMFPASLIAQLVKNLPAMQETACSTGDPSSIPGSERLPGEGNSNPLHYSCLENPMEREAWRATVPGVRRVRHDLMTKPHMFPAPGDLPNPGIDPMSLVPSAFLENPMDKRD